MNKGPRNNLTRGRLTARIVALLLEKFPTAWNAHELELCTGAGRRTVERVVADLCAAGVIEKKYHSYGIATTHLGRIYGAQWIVRQEIEKDIMIQRSIADGKKIDTAERRDGIG